MQEKQLELFPETRVPVSDMVAEFARVTHQPINLISARNIFNEELHEFLVEYDNPDAEPTQELKELADMVYTAYGYARARGWDLTGAIESVHKNNVGRVFQDDGSIKRRDDGKILKNPDYPKVDLESFIGEWSNEETDS